MIGTHVARYRIDSLLGEGGMGKVYRAFDESLGRSLALKILPADVTRDAERLERFIREARTASGLSHPNVVTIYEVGEAESTHFIAMELVEGETLRERLVKGRMELRRAVDIVAQVADGVAAAHAAGVVHRDLKPENIVLAKSGFAKILDFGLAKLREIDAARQDDAATAVKKTAPGTVLGTVGYMSPEQARGEETDHRTDIFSLGCILYECLAGVRPFRGESSVDTLHKVIYSDPRPLAEIAPDAPHELHRIVRKCLAKDPDARYQSAKDLAIDLRDLRREMESQPSGLTAPAAPLRRKHLWPALAAGAVVVIAAIVALVVLRREGAKSAPPAAQPSMAMTRLTTSGKVIGAAISPNGEYLAYAYSDAGQQSVWVRQVTTGSALELVPPDRRGVWGIGFSNDSRSLYYGIKAPSDPAGGLYVIPILGGQSRRILQGVDSRARFSPDGRRMAVLRNHTPQPGHWAVVVANADGSGEKVVTSKAPPQSLSVFWGAPAWSPDGKSLAFALRDGKTYRLMQIDVESGKESALSSDEWIDLGDVEWLPDGTGVLVIGSAGDQMQQIWFVARDGTRRRITHDLSRFRVVSLTADGRQLVSVAADASSSIWRVPLSADERPAKLTDGRYDGARGVAAAPGGTLYFSSIDSGQWEIWSLDPSGQRRQITAAAWPAAGVAVSPDGRYLVTTMPRQNGWVLGRVNADGSGLKDLCPVVPAREGYARFDFTPDGKWVVFDSAADGVWRIYKVPVEGGTPILVRERGDSPAVSPDGRYVAYINVMKIEVAPFDGGEPVGVFDQVSVTNSSMVRWSEDGKGILHNAGLNDRINVWYQPLDGSPARPVTRFDDEYIHKLDPTPDGKALIVSRGVLARDAILIRDFR